VAGPLAGVDVAGTLAGDGVAVGDGRTVRCGAGVGIADLVRSAEEVGRGLTDDRGRLCVCVTAGCTVDVGSGGLACAGLTSA
jgi:hypothetical protein